MAHLWFLLPWPLIFELSEFPQRIYHDVKEVEHPLPLNTFPGDVFLVAVESTKMWSKPEGTTVDTSAGFVIRNYLASWFMTHLSTGRKQIKLYLYRAREIIHLHPVPGSDIPVPPLSSLPVVILTYLKL